MFFFELSGVPPDVLTSNCFAMLLSGYPSDDQTYDIHENNHLGLVRRQVVCEPHSQPSDAALLTVRVVRPLDKHPDGRTARRVIDDIASGVETVLSESELEEFLEAKTPLAFWRKKRGMTQVDLARATGVAQGFLSEIETGQKPGTPATLKKIAEALNIKVDDLIS